MAATPTEPEALEPREESTAWSGLKMLLLLSRRLISLSDDLALSLACDVPPTGAISLHALAVAGVVTAKAFCGSKTAKAASPLMYLVDKSRGTATKYI